MWESTDETKIKWEYTGRTKLKWDFHELNENNVGKHSSYEKCGPSFNTQKQVFCRVFSIFPLFPVLDFSSWRPFFPNENHSLNGHLGLFDSIIACSRPCRNEIEQNFFVEADRKPRNPVGS